MEFKSNPSANKDLFLMLNPCMTAVTALKVPGGFDKFIQQSVRRFSISYRDLSRYLTPFIEGHKITHNPTRTCPMDCNNLVRQKNSALINAHFLSFFTPKQ